MGQNFCAITSMQLVTFCIAIYGHKPYMYMIYQIIHALVQCCSLNYSTIAVAIAEIGNNSQERSAVPIVAEW